METVEKEPVYTVTDWEGLHMVPGMWHIMTVHMLFITVITITIHTSTGTAVYVTGLSGQHIVMACITTLAHGQPSDIFIPIITGNMYSLAWVVTGR